MKKLLAILLALVLLVGVVPTVAFADTTCDCDEFLPAKGEEVVTEATCTKDGSKKVFDVCADCGKRYNEEVVTIPATGHAKKSKWQQVSREIKPDTCTEVGIFQEWFICPCGEFMEAASGEYEVNNLKKHKEVAIPGVPATCTKTGLFPGKKCEICGEITLKQVVTPVVDHNTEAFGGKAATCTETGLFPGQKCKDCGKVTVEPVETPKVPHKEVSLAKSATCTETGLKNGKKCEVCGEITLEPTVVEKLAHTASAAICDEASRVNATCAAAGSVDYYTECTVCKTELSRVTYELPKLAHNYKNTGKTEVTQEAGCVACEVTAQIWACEACGDTELFNHAPTKDPIGHKFSYQKGIKETCTTDGRLPGQVCDVCGYYDEWMKLPATNHANQSSKYEVVIPGTCQEKAVLGLVTRCDDCGEITMEWNDTKPGKLGNHVTVWNTVTDKDATCTEAGEAHKEQACIYCDKVFQKTEAVAVDALGHDFKDGKCTVCGAADPDYVAPTEPAATEPAAPEATKPAATEPAAKDDTLDESPKTGSNNNVIIATMTGIALICAMAFVFIKKRSAC